MPSMSALGRMNSMSVHHATTTPTAIHVPWRPERCASMAPMPEKMSMPVSTTAKATVRSESSKLAASMAAISIIRKPRPSAAK